MNTLKTLMVLLSFQLAAADSTSINDQSEYQNWKEARLERLKEPHGWLSLVGLEWLHIGENTIGAANDNMIQLTHGPDYLGVIYLPRNKELRFIPTQSTNLKADDQIVTNPTQINADSHEAGATVFTIDTFQFYIIERGEKMAVRIIDSEAKTRTEFFGLDYFAENSKFRIDAQFIPYQPAKIIPTVNVLGILTDEESPGRLEFSIDGIDYSLDALNSDDSYYMIFGDKTNGQTTYGPGRFLYTDGKVNEAGEVRIDFNKAYNPPCAFTPFSTCTLPPLQNRMRVEVMAGEKKYANSQY